MDKSIPNSVSFSHLVQSRLFSYNDAHLYRLGTNYTQLPVNRPINPVANFQRDGNMAFDDNQGNRPNYKSTIKPMKYAKRPYNVEHEVFVGHAIADLSEVTELDFEPARALWSKVFDDGAKERYVKNVGGHLGNVSVERIKSDQVAIFLAVDEDLGKRVAQEIGLKKIPQAYKPLPASSAYRFVVDQQPDYTFRILIPLILFIRFAPNLKSTGKQVFGNQANGLH